MKIEMLEKIGDVKPEKGALKAYAARLLQNKERYYDKVQSRAI